MYNFNMNRRNLNLVQQMSLDDLDKLYDQIITNSTGANSMALMGLLSSLRERKLFNQDFFEYWLVKLLNAPNSIGLFFLDEPNYKILGFDPKTIGQFLSHHLMFLKNYHSSIEPMVEHALHNDCFFEPGFLNQFQIEENNLVTFRKKNQENIEKYLFNSLDDKFQKNQIKI